MALEAAIGYEFKNRELLAEALTHRSALNESQGELTRDNQRLEFFGDSVISLFVSRMLLERFPASREGELSRLRASLVDEASLARLAGLIGIGDCLVLGRGESRGGGREKKSMLADAYEALIGAIYLDGGPEGVLPVIEAHFAPLMDGLAVEGKRGDFKTELQERCQSLYGSVPAYILKGENGPGHARRFSVEVFIGDRLMGKGEGKSKKEAQQAAAREAISTLAPVRENP